MTTYIQHARLNQCRAELPELSQSASTLVRVGDRLGFFEALGSLGSMTSDELAEVTCTSEPYVAGWLDLATDAGLVECLPRFQRYTLPRQAGVYAPAAQGSILIPDVNGSN